MEERNGTGETRRVVERERVVQPPTERVVEPRTGLAPEAESDPEAEAEARREADRERGGRFGSESDARERSDPFAAESDAREERMDRVAVLYAHITAATREFLAAVAECDRHRDWLEAGFGSCGEWLAWRVGLRRNAANERVRVARALEELPRTSEAMARGELSYSKVRAVTRVATPDSEGDLLELARAGSTAHLERIVRAWKVLDRDDEQRRERMLHRTRRFSVVPDGEGMYVVRGRLMPEVAALLMRAVDAAGDALYAGSSADERNETDPAQRRADAVALLAERALAAGFGRRGGRRTQGPSDQPAGAHPGGPADRDAVGRGGPTHRDAVGRGGPASRDDVTREGAGVPEDDAGADAAVAPLSGSRAERYQVMLYVEPATLAETGEPGVSELDDGTRVSAETARRLACDAAIVEVRRSKGGPSTRTMLDAGRTTLDPARTTLDPGRAIRDAGRRTRTVSAPLRRALEARDRGCRFPGCACRFTDAHHIVHWADGGSTRLNNLVLLCARHHRRVHEDGWRIYSDRTGHSIVFVTPDGRALAAAPPMPDLDDATLDPVAPTSVGGDPSAPSPSADPLAALIAYNAARGIRPDWRTNLPDCRHDHTIPWTIEAAARDALDPPDAADAPHALDAPDSARTPDAAHPPGAADVDRPNAAELDPRDTAAPPG